MKISFALIAAIFLVLGLNAQEEKSNIQTYTPSKLLNKGEFEVKLFTGLYSQNEQRDRDGETISIGQTQAFINSFLQITTGLSEDARFNFGIDVNLTSARYGLAKDNGPLDFFGSNETFKQTVISSIGPRVKFNLSKSIPRLSVQSSFLFPTSNKLEENQFIAHDRYTWFTQFFYDRSLGDNWQVFLEVDYLYRMNRNSRNDRNFFRTPVSGFLSYFPSSKATVFGFAQYSPRFEVVENSVEEQFGLSQWFTQIGVGGKYQLTSKLELELSYSDFILSRVDGAGYNLNFGLRYIHR